ncbi:MAG TPA: DUF2752 domain-containing protein [Verrucomicrobiae bacterium]
MSNAVPPPLLPLPSPNRRKVILWSLAFGAFIVVLLVLHFFPPGQYPIYPVCPLREGTGLDCPGCGGLRAMHQLTNGNIAAAWRLNPAVFVILPLAAYETLMRVFLKRPERSVLAHTPSLIALGVLLLVFSVGRNLPKLAQWFP